MDNYRINFEDSYDAQLEPANWLPRNKSEDSMFGLIKVHSYGQRQLIIDYQPNQQDKSKIFRAKQKKQKIKKACDYRKNICGYITKKIIREYLSQTYINIATDLCHKYGCTYQESKTYFLSKIERITGPSHVPSLFKPLDISEVPIKQAFRQFFIWFTKQRYLRYLLLQGKMNQKQAYIEYKNTVLMSLVNRQTQPYQHSNQSEEHSVTQ